ncbi:unnamed protein product [Phytomonas sp. EM1]|nr:unnamed protein product [Phytomonas sp. EM1]|eukprot:CCW63916.1 unnamed protein product [Phytomonas sp. isolate EM1]
MFIRYFAIGSLCGVLACVRHCRDLVAENSRELRAYYKSIADCMDQMRTIEELAGPEGVSVRELTKFSTPVGSTQRAKRVTYIFP